ncbi:MAG: hypothetical protein SPL17_02100, partial [Bacteroidales bacterium]|nr:hypothetical protein [Bacteroidales bacterium]
PLYRQEKEWKQEEADTFISGQTIKRINELFALDKTLADKLPKNVSRNVYGLKKTSWRLSLPCTKTQGCAKISIEQMFL